MRCVALARVALGHAQATIVRGGLGEDAPVAADAAALAADVEDSRPATGGLGGWLPFGPGVHAAHEADGALPSRAGSP